MPQLDRRRPAAEIATSSMADLAFLLLIFFMVTATFTVHQGLDFRTPPDTDTPEVDPVEAVLVEVLGGGVLQIDGRAAMLQDLLPYLAPKLTRNPGKPVIVKPQPEAPYGAMVAVLDELRQGRTRLGLAQEIVVALPTERETLQLWG